MSASRSRDRAGAASGHRAKDGAPAHVPSPAAAGGAEPASRDALVTLAERVRPCARCFNLTEEELCAICRDQRRDAALICAVEEASDIGAIERAGEFRGVYHVLGGRLSPLDGVGPEDLTIDRSSWTVCRTAGFAR